MGLTRLVDSGTIPLATDPCLRHRMKEWGVIHQEAPVFGGFLVCHLATLAVLWPSELPTCRKDLGVAAISAAEKYAEGPRPECECHGVEMRWGADAKRRLGGRWCCVVRTREATRKSYAAHREASSVRHRKYHAANLEREIQRGRRYYRDNREELLAKDKKRYDSRRLEGRCYSANCEEPLYPGSYLCSSHRSIRSVQNSTRSRKRRGLLPLSESRTRDLCDWCGQPLVPHPDIGRLAITAGQHVICFGCNLKSGRTLSLTLQAKYPIVIEPRRSN